MSFNDEFQIAEGQELKAGETYEFDAEINLPENLNGTYKGENAEHYYEIFAGVDCAGNDPDSGWKVFEIY